MGSLKLNNHQPESITQDESDKFWNCSVLKRSAWMSQLARTLARDDPNFRTLWEECYIVEKHVAITQSARHSFHLSINNVQKHTLFKPCPSNNSNYSTHQSLMTILIQRSREAFARRQPC